MSMTTLSKAERKIAGAAGDNESAFTKTNFGRRARPTGVMRAAKGIFGIIKWPNAFFRRVPREVK